MKLYSASAVEKLIQQYIEKDGHVITIQEGTLGYGLTILLADGYKSAVITEVALNEWQSGHKVRMYNSLPQKYQDMLEDVYV